MGLAETITSRITTYRALDELGEAVNTTFLARYLVAEEDGS